MSTATLPGPRTSPRTSPRAGTRTDPRPAPGTRGASATTTPGRRPATRSAGTTTDPKSGTAPFVLLIMVLLTGGLVATLWLSTAAAADSYRLDEARQVARDLSEQSERLHRDVEAAQSAPALAAAAQAQGMVPAGEPAVLLVNPDGSSQVVGDPRPAQAPPAPATPNPPPAAPPQQTNGAQAAVDGQPAPAPAGAAAAEDQLVAVPSGTGPQAARDEGTRPDASQDPARESQQDGGPQSATPDATPNAATAPAGR